VKTNVTRYSPTFKFQVCWRPSRPRGRGPRPRWRGPTGCTWSRWPMEEAHLKGESMEKRMKGRHVSSIAHHSSRVTHHEFYYRSPMEYLISEGIVPKTLAENGVRGGSAPRGAGP